MSAMDQLQTLFKTDAAMLELMLDQSGALADEVAEDESSESYSAWSLMVRGCYGSWMVMQARVGWLSWYNGGLKP